MHYRRLGRTGLNVSTIAFGASPLGGSFRSTADEVGVECVRTALDSGINFIDTAPLYGLTRSETILGRALRGVPRGQFILATKIGQYGNGEIDFSAARVVQSLDESCARLGLDYIDLILCHDVEDAAPELIVGETLPALARLRAQGRIGHIGFSGLPLRIFPAILDLAAEGIVEVILSHSHYTLANTTLGRLVPYLQGKQVGIINAAPTGMGLLTAGGPPAWHPASSELAEGCRRAAEFCQAHGQDIVQLAVQFAISHPAFSTLVVGTANPENVRRNVAFAEAPIDFEFMAAVLQVLRPVHNLGFGRDLT